MTATIKGINRMGRHIQPRKRRQDQLRQLCTQSRDTLRELTGLFPEKSLEERALDEAADEGRLTHVLFVDEPLEIIFEPDSLGLSESMNRWTGSDSLAEEDRYFKSQSRGRRSSKRRRKNHRQGGGISIEALMGVVPITQGKMLFH